MSKILITDGGYSHSLAIIRSLTNLGHIVDCIGHPLCLSAFSKSLNKCAFKQSEFKIQNIESFLNFLEKEKYDFLIPIGANSVFIVNRFRKEISKKVKINLAPYESIQNCLSKDKLLSIAQELEIPTPKIYTKKELEKYRYQISENKKQIVIKPSSELSNKKVVYTSKLDEINKYLKSEKKFLFQDYINGYGVGFFAIYDNGVLVQFFMHKRIRENPPSGGSSVCAESIYDKKLYLYGKRLLDKLKWHGVAMVEFKKQIDTKELFLMEVNPKFWASHDLAIESGINFAEKYLEIEENKPSKNITYKNKEKLNYILNKRFQWLARDISSSLLRPLRLIRVVYTFLILRAKNNLYLSDPICSLYLIIYAFFSPILKTKFFFYIYTLLSRIRKFGIKITFIRYFSELTGIPILKYSMISKNIAIGSAPSKFGMFYLNKNGFKYIIDLRSEGKNIRSKNKNLKTLYIPVQEYDAPTFKQFEKVSDLIYKANSNNEKIYIHCREGISRAPSFLIAYYIKFHNLSFQEALDRILFKRRFVVILNNQKKRLLEYSKFLKK